jgi:predicted DNA-binding protein (UPF0251 family)
MQNNTSLGLLGSLELSKPSMNILALKLIEPFQNDEKTAIEMDMQLKFVEETVKQAREKINIHVVASNITKGLEIEGCKVSRREGYAVLNYEDDKEYLRLKTLLAERKELLDSAFKSNHNIVTDEGEVIPKVSVKSYTKDSVSYTFKK